MERLGLEAELLDPVAYGHSVDRLRQAQVVLPTFAQLTHPARIPKSVRQALLGVDPDQADPMNLFRVHWFNDDQRLGFADAPRHLVLPQALTVESPILVALGDRFPMIRAHKVLAAYSIAGPPPHHGSVRSYVAAGHLAIDRQLLSWWRCDLPTDDVPQHRFVASGHEPRALRVA